jgi:Protein of unknown function (DUF3180)
MTPPLSTPPDSPNPPRMRPTSIATLCVAALVTAALTWLGVSRYYGNMPPLPWLPALTLAGLALVEAVIAPSTKARIERKEGTAPVNPLVVARYVPLAKASAMAGALFAGAYGALVVFLLSEWGKSVAVNRDVPPAAVGLVAAFGLVAAGLWLERACRVPPTPPEQGTPPADDWADDERSGGDRSGV